MCLIQTRMRRIYRKPSESRALKLLEEILSMYLCAVSPICYLLSSYPTAPPTSCLLETYPNLCLCKGLLWWLR